MVNLREEALNLDCVEKETKHGLFLVNGFDGDAWLDLREDSVSFYVYGQDGVKDVKPPQGIKKLKQLKAAEGNSSLGEFG